MHCRFRFIQSIQRQFPRSEIQPDQYWTASLRHFETLLYQSRSNGAPGESKQYMLQQFSWQQFWITIGVFGLLWYVVVVLLFYRRELRSFLSGGGWRADGSGGPVASGTAAALPHRWQKGVQDISGSDLPLQEGLNPEDDLMGRSRLPEGMSSVSMGEVSFFSGEEGSFDPGSRDVEQQQGLVPDVLQDIKEVFGILAKEDGTKRDFFRLMETVRLSYPGLSAHPALRRINGFIAEHASFHLSAEELEDLWG